MKIIIVSGSKRKGNSEYLAKEVEKYLREVDSSLEITTLLMSQANFSFCTGCLQCDETHQCCITDDFTYYAEEVRQADALILISPVRWSLMSGEMKCFLDRLNPLAVNMELADKKCLTIVIGQSDEDEGKSLIDASRSFVLFAENAEINVYKQIEIYSCLSPNDIRLKEETLELCKQSCLGILEE